MLERPDLWCVAGVPGVGKTTLSNQLLETGQFEVVEHDEYSRQVWEELDAVSLARLHNPGNFKDFREYGQAVKKAAGMLREKFGKILQIVNYPGFENAKRNEPYFRFLHGIRDDHEFLEEFFSQAQVLLNHINSLLSHFAAFERSAEIALLKQKTTLLVENTLTGKVIREATLRYFRGKQLSPGLLIMQGQRSRLLETARQRRLQSRGSAIFQDRGDVRFIDSAEDYETNEGWERVLIVDRENVDTGINEIRERLFGQISLPSEDVSFVKAG